MAEEKGRANAAVGDWVEYAVGGLLHRGEVTGDTWVAHARTLHDYTVARARCAPGWADEFEVQVGDHGDVSVTPLRALADLRVERVAAGTAVKFRADCEVRAGATLTCDLTHACCPVESRLPGERVYADSLQKARVLVVGCEPGLVVKTLVGTYVVPSSWPLKRLRAEWSY